MESSRIHRSIFNLQLWREFPANTWNSPTLKVKEIEIWKQTTQILGPKHIKSHTKLGRNMCIWQWLKSQSLRTMWVPAFRRYFFDSFWASVKSVDLARICHSCWNPVCFFHWFSMLRFTSFCLWNCITLRWEEHHFLFRFPKHLPDFFTAFLKWSASGPAWVRFSKRHKSRHMSSLQKVSRVSPMRRMEARWESLGMTFLKRALRFVWKNLTLLVRHIHDISSKKRSGK